MSRPFRRFRRPYLSRKKPTTHNTASTSGIESGPSEGTSSRAPPQRSPSNSEALNFSDDEPSTSTLPPKPKSKRPLVRFFLEEDDDQNETLLGGLSNQCPSWKLYFSNEAFTKRPDILEKAKAFTWFIDNHPNLFDYDTIRTNLSFPLPIEILLENAEFLTKWPSFRTCLQESPQETLSICTLAMHQQLETDQEFNFTVEPSKSKNPQNLEKLRSRPSGLSITCPLKDLKLDQFGNMITVCGTIVRANTAALICQWMCYKCKRCGRKQVLKQYRKPNQHSEVIPVTPTNCQLPCRARTGFVEQLSSKFTQVVLLQTVRLQETVKSYEHGLTPRTIEVELDAELVDATDPGDDVTVTGTLVLVEEESDNTITSVMLRAFNLISKKKLGKQFDVFTSSQMLSIHQIRDQPFTLRQLVRSFCHEICGHDVVKAGLLLAMFGAGAPCAATDRFRSRPEVHVLLVGEPGIGKSQMLQSAAKLSPRSTYVSGHSSSRAGLLASVCNENMASTGGIEAGALVLADMGVCCIDELDKMTANEDALLEVMEQQIVSIAKASVICNLTARTTLIAAANPHHGHYEYEKTVAENIRMSPALLSRFDLIFVLMDNDSQEGDSFFSNHIERLSNSASCSSSNDPLGVFSPHRRRFDGVIGQISNTEFQSYIAYARQNCHPRLGIAAKDAIEAFWRKLRHEQAVQGDSITITARHLLPLIRLTLARARIDLMDEATLEHAQDVIAIMKRTLVCRMDRNSQSIPGSSASVMSRIGVARTQRGMGMKAQLQRFLTALRNFSELKKKKMLSQEELKYVAGLANVTKIDEVFELANLNGCLLKKSNGMFELIGAGF